MSNRGEPAERYPVLSCFLVILSLARGRPERLFATIAALVPLLIVCLQGHSAQGQNTQQRSQKRRVETPQARVRRRERVLWLESYFGKQRSLARSFRR